MSKAHSTIESFGYAFDGIKTAFRKEPNFRIHSSVGVAAIILAGVLGFNSYEWIILVFTIFLVLVLELINTSLETLVDLVSPEISEKAKVAKDVSAAAVFLTTTFAALVGVFLFLPKILKLVI